MNGRPAVFSLIAITVGVYMGFVGALYLIQDKLIYHPSQYLPSPAESGLAEMRPVPLTTKDGLKLTSWYKTAEKGQPTSFPPWHVHPTDTAFFFGMVEGRMV